MRLRGNTTASRILLLATATALVAAVAGAWVFERLARDPEVPGSRVSVLRGGRELRTFDMDGLRALGMRRVVDQGKEQEGPTLLSVLDASGVESFAEVTIVGYGLRDSGRLVLRRNQVNPDVVLDIAERGTSKVVGPSIEYESRVRDVIRIEVR